MYTADHKVYELPPLLSWEVTHTGTVPCDSFSVTFLFQREMAPMLRGAAGFVAEDRGQVMLRAVVDEYTVDLNGGGLTATVNGRGYAARLLDNESRPVTYQQATLEEILRNPVIFGCDLAEMGLSEKIQGMTKELLAGPGAVRETLKRYLA